MHAFDLSSEASLVPALGVIIPTYNRWPKLRECLLHLEAQTEKNFEVVVVDDGSTDETRQQLEMYARTAAFPLRILHQPNSGPARARNQAIAHLAAPICLMIGDDTFPGPDLVRIHLAFHREHPELEAGAVGLTRWSETGQTVTPFMRWLDRDGVQFAFGELLAGVPPGWRHFYTSNLSLKTAYLRQNPFNESFPSAGMEDIELGFRLASRHSLHMFFLPDAVVEHLHPTTFRVTCRRALATGFSWYRFAQLWPEHRYLTPKNPLKRILLPLLTEPRVILPTLTALTDLITRVRCPNPFLPLVLQLHERLGYNRAAATSPQHQPREI